MLAELTSITECPSRDFRKPNKTPIYKTRQNATTGDDRDDDAIKQGERERDATVDRAWVRVVAREVGRKGVGSPELLL